MTNSVLWFKPNSCWLWYLSLEYWCNTHTQNVEVTLELGNRGWKIFEQSDIKYILIHFLEQTVSRNTGANDATVPMFHPYVMFDSVMPKTAARQAPLSSTLSWSLLKFMSMEWVMYNHLILCFPFSSCLLSFPASVFSNELALHIRWPKYWSFNFSISLSTEYSRLISFRIDWFDSRDPQGSSPAPEFESINYLVLSILHGPTLTSIHDYWKNHSFHYMDLCQQSDVSDF